MIVGIGVDIVDLERIANLWEHFGQKFINRILSDKEKEAMQSMEKDRKISFISGRFAAKEAFVKAIGSGIGKLAFKDISIASGGQPKVVQNEKIRQILISKFGSGEYNILVTISHERNSAVAMTLIDKLG